MSQPFYSDGEWKDVGLALMQRNGPGLLAALSQVVASVVLAENGLPAGPAIVGLVGGGALAGTQWLLAKLTLAKLRVDKAVRESADQLALEHAARRALENTIVNLRCGREVEARLELDWSGAQKELERAADDVIRDLSRDVAAVRREVAQIHTLLRSSLPNPSARIWPFLDEYLREKSALPVPFGGRDDELKRLTSWLTDPSSGPYFLVTSPAGRGKSALMVRWMVHLTEQRLLAAGAAELDQLKWNAIFLPISIRFRTNRPEDYHLLLAKALADIVKPEGGLGQAACDTAGFYADRASECFERLSESGRRVLLVVDGLDESLRAFEPLLLPQHPPANVRVVVAARWIQDDIDSSGWIKRLSWQDHNYQTLELSALSNAAIRDVLQKLGADMGRLVCTDQVVERLAVLTDREPLLLSYYAMDMWRQSSLGRLLTVEELADLKPGFGAYFERWLVAQDQHCEAASGSHERVDVLLSIFSIAYGPLFASDIHALSERLGVRSSFDIQRALKPIERFVMGYDGPERGYVLNHPKLSEYLRKERYASSVGKTQRAFVSWVIDSIARQNAMQDPNVEVSAYLLHFGPRHLDELCAPLEEFMTLVQNGWRLAWEKSDEGAVGFANDVQTAWRRAGRGSPRNPALQFRCALALSSVRSLGQDLPGAVICAAAQQRLLSLQQAAQLARSMSDPVEAAEVLATLATHMTDTAARESFLEEATHTAETLSDDWVRIHALSMLAPSLSYSHTVRLLVTLVELMSRRTADYANYDWEIARITKAVVPRLKHDDLDVALSITARVAAPWLRAEVLSAVVPHLDSEQLRRAIENARDIPSEDNQALALVAIAERLDPRERSELVAEALAKLRTLQHGAARGSTFGRLSPLLDAQQRVAEVTEWLAYSLEVDTNRAAEALPWFAQHLTREQIDRWLGIVSGMEARDRKLLALSALVPHLDSEQQSAALAEAIETAGGCRARALNDVLSLLAPLASSSQLRRLYTLCLGIRVPWYRRRAIGHLVPAMTSELLADALRSGRRIGAEQEQGRALVFLAPQCGRMELQKALDFVMSVEVDWYRAEMLSALAPQLPMDSLVGALRTVQGFRDGWSRARAQGSLLKHLPTSQRTSYAAKVLASGVSNCFAGQGEWSLSDFIDCVPGPTRTAMLEEALQAIFARTVSEHEAVCLSSVLPHLSEERSAKLAREYVDLVMANEAEFRAPRLSPLLPYLDADPRALVVAEILSCIPATPFDLDRRDALIAISPYLNGGQVVTAMANARALRDNEARARAVSAIVRCMESRVDALSVMESELEAAKSLLLEQERANVLKALAPSLTSGHLLIALTIAKEMDGHAPRAAALSGLAPYSSVDDSRECLALWLQADIYRHQMLDELSSFKKLFVGQRAVCQSLMSTILEASDWYP